MSDKRLFVGNTELDVPAFFPSVSSVKTALRPCEYVRLLTTVGNINGKLLVSAYDIFHADAADKGTINDLLSQAKSNGLIVLMDSGNYENYWKSGNWDQQDFHEVLRNFDCSLVLSFDEQDPPQSIVEHTTLICRRYFDDQTIAGDRPVIPIIHAMPGDFPTLCVNVVRETGAQMLALPERRLGEGIFERALTLKSIRAALEATGKYIGIHLLGTGNPMSIAIYSVTGADSYDGLEWCQTTVDYNSSTLYHFSQADFFSRQSDWGEADLPYQMRTLLHNLQFYDDWLRRLRNSIADGQGVEFCESNFSPSIFLKCAEVMGWSSR